MMNVTKTKITTTVASGFAALIFLAAAGATATSGDASQEVDHPFGSAEQAQATQICAGEQAGAQILSLLQSADNQPAAVDEVSITIDREALNDCVAVAEEKHNKGFENLQTRKNIENTYKWLGGVGFAFAFTMGAHMLVTRRRDEDEVQHAQAQSSPAPSA